MPGSGGGSAALGVLAPVRALDPNHRSVSRSTVTAIYDGYRYDAANVLPSNAGHIGGLARKITLIWRKHAAAQWRSAPPHRVRCRSGDKNGYATPTRHRYTTDSPAAHSTVYQRYRVRAPSDSECAGSSHEQERSRRMKTKSSPRRHWRRAWGVSPMTCVVGLSLAVSAIGAQTQAPVFPELIQLPAGFGSEGIAVGRGHTFYVGSFTPPMLGQILIGDLRNGRLSELVPPTGRAAVGMKHDARTNYLYVAGGPSGRGTIYDAGSGVEIASHAFAPPGVTIINDVALTREAAYFTDSFRPVLGRVALTPDGAPLNAVNIPLPANFGVAGLCTFGFPPRSNGIAATTNGRYLVLMHMSEGRIYLLDTATFDVLPIDVTGGDSAAGSVLCGGDGLLLDGQTLYVVQAPLHRVAVVELSPDHLSGVLTRYITEPFASNALVGFPTTVAEFGNALYAVTYGDAPPTPDYVVRLTK